MHIHATEYNFLWCKSTLRTYTRKEKTALLYIYINIDVHNLIQTQLFKYIPDTLLHTLISLLNNSYSNRFKLLCMHASLYLCLSISVCLFLSVILFLSVYYCPSVSFSLFDCLSLSVCLSIFVRVSVNLDDCLSENLNPSKNKISHQDLSGCRKKLDHLSDLADHHIYTESFYRLICTKQGWLI